MAMQEDRVHIQITKTGADGVTRFVDEYIPYAGTSGPLRVTEPVPATAMSFRWTPGDFDMDFHPAARRRLVMVIEGGLEITVGNGESRIFRPGDILSIRDIAGQGHRSRAIDGKPFRSAFVALDDVHSTDRREPMSAADAGGIDYIHNQETAQGSSYFEKKHMPYVYGGAEGMETREIELKAFQFVFAAPTLDYDWHQAPQRQVVLVLTGGLAVEYGDGSHSTVPPGHFLVGEDTDGKGHITRALNGQPRFSVFGHLR